jgi:DNA-binding NarL/FixJ family response regulator
MIATDFAPFKTIVIERQSLMAKALRALFDQNPAVHVVADSTSLNVDDLQRHRPNLIIFGCDNITDELADVIKTARSIVPDVRFCVLSSYANPALMKQCMSEGADGFLLKDMPLSELDIALRIMSSGSCYVDPRVAGQMLNRRYQAATPGARLAELSTREAEILKLLAGGLANKEIGVKLGLSEKTVKNYISGMFVKLNVSARTQAAVFAIKAGMI